MARKLTKLKRAYLRYNRLYFNHRLPVDTPVHWSFNMGKARGYYLDDQIRISVKDRRDWRLTLLHEMCHQITESERAHHGPRWLRQMRRLARLGAFDKLW